MASSMISPLTKGPKSTCILILLTCLLNTARSWQIVLDGDDPPNPLVLVEVGEQIILKGKDCEYFYASADIKNLPNFATTYSLNTNDDWTTLSFKADEDTFGQYGCCKLKSHVCNNRLIEANGSKNLKEKERLCTETENQCAPTHSRSCVIDALEHRRCECIRGWSGAQCESPITELNRFPFESSSIGRHFVVAILLLLTIASVVCVVVRMYRKRQKKAYDQVELEEGNGV